MTSSKKPKAKARGVAQPALPGLEPSPAWQKLKSTPKKQRQTKEHVHRQNAGPGHPSWRQNVVPGKCTCGDKLFEDNGVRGITNIKDLSKGEYDLIQETPDPNGVKANPWVIGHAYWCSMFMPKCDECGQLSGTHSHKCSFWKLHPNITPF